jgi:hypothetical protein
MSRSVRKPYCMPALGVASQSIDRQRSNRAYRRLFNQRLTGAETADKLLPIREEACWGSRAIWSGDGRQRLISTASPVYAQLCRK